MVMGASNIGVEQPICHSNEYFFLRTHTAGTAAGVSVRLPNAFVSFDLHLHLEDTVQQHVAKSMPSKLFPEVAKELVLM